MMEPIKMNSTWRQRENVRTDPVTDRLKSRFCRRLFRQIIFFLFCIPVISCAGDDPTGDRASGDYEIAIGKATHAIQMNPTSANLYKLRAMIYVSNSKFEEGISDCDEAIRLDPNNLSSYNLRGYAYFHLSQYNKAIRDYTKGIQLTTNLTANDEFNNWTYFLRGNAYALKGNLAKAISDYNHAVELGVTNADIYFQLGTAYGRWGEYEKAIAEFSKSVEHNGAYSTAFASRGLAYSYIGNYTQGIADCEKAVRLNPGDLEANNNLAWLLSIAPDAKLRDGKRALGYAQKACGLTDWKYAPTLGTLAAAYAETGNFDAALKWERKSIELGVSRDELATAHQMLKSFEEKKPFHEKH